MVLSAPLAPLVEKLIGLEVRAARLEALLDVEPDLGRIWRSGMALLECSKSTSLEDIAVFEGDVALRDRHTRPLSAEASRGVSITGDLISSLESTNPFSIGLEQDDLVRRLTRLWRAGRVSNAPVGGYEGLRDVHVEEAEADPDPDFACILPEIRRTFVEPVTPVLAGLDMVVAFRSCLAEPAPASERLIFLLGDEAARASSFRHKSITGPEPIRRWCLCPSLALGGSGFKIWSPVTLKGLDDLLEGLNREAGRGLGAIPILRSWIHSLNDASKGAHGRSRYPDFLKALPDLPILDIDMVAARLDITWHGARNLVNKAESEGLIRPVTGRRSWRAWACPWMADILRSRSSVRTPQGRTVSIEGTGPKEDDGKEGMTAKDLPDSERALRLEPIEDDPGIRSALEELDAAMKSADDILAKYRKRGD